MTVIQEAANEAAARALARKLIKPPEPWDWKKPDYDRVFMERRQRLADIRAEVNRQLVHGDKWTLIDDMKLHYAEWPAAFINDWGVTFDPRNAELGQPTIIPFILFERQIEWIDYVLRKWKAQEPGLTEKSRDMGVSWLAMALSSALCIFNFGVSIGVGSRKSEYVDKIGTEKPLLPKARMFVKHLPEEFRGGYMLDDRTGPYMRLSFPATGSEIGGEGGDDLGRGDRRSMFFVDEYAFFERPELTEASLSQTTNCRQDISTPQGMNNVFARKRWGGKVEPFIFDWKQDPRKDKAWYDKQVRELDPVVVAQEIDRDYTASVEGIVIPQVWVKSALDAHRVLGIAPAGPKWLDFDVADEGVDKNATVGGQGVSVDYSRAWSGKGADIFSTVQDVFREAEERDIDVVEYDADGLGAGVRGDARTINEQRRSIGISEIPFRQFRGSEAVFNPEGIVEGTHGREGDKGRLNKDYFMNHKAQGWWSLRRRFQMTHRWVTDGVQCDASDIININPADPNHLQLMAEFSRPTYTTNLLGKIVIDKKPDGSPSPNLADCVMMRFAPKEMPPAQFTDAMVRQIVVKSRMQRANSRFTYGAR